MCVFVRVYVPVCTPLSLSLSFWAWSNSRIAVIDASAVVAVAIDFVCCLLIADHRLDNEACSPPFRVGC